MLRDEPRFRLLLTGQLLSVLGGAGLLVAGAVVAVPAVRRLPRGPGAAEEAFRPEPPPGAPA